MGRHPRDKSELNKCPICGNSARVRRVEQKDVVKFHGYCTVCGTRSEGRLSFESAVRTWNKKKILFAIDRSENFSKFGCLYCANIKNAEGKEFSEWDRHPFCPYKDCPYASILEEFDDYEDYFENSTYVYDSPFSAGDHYYHLTLTRIEH